MAPTVIIRKQKIKINTSSEQLALHIRKLLNDTLQYELIDLIEKMFAAYAPADAYINIDTLKVDLGSITLQDFEKHFSAFAEPKLLSEFKKVLQKNNEPVTSIKPENFDINTAGKFPQSGTNNQHELTALLYFLQHGVYPWWYKKEYQKTPAALLNDLSDKETAALLKGILSGGYSKEEKEKIGRRLFMHLPEAKSESIIYRLLALYNNVSLTASIKILLNQKDSLTRLFSISVKEFYRQLFQFLINDVILQEERIVYNFILQLTKEKNISLQVLSDGIEAIESKDFSVAGELLNNLSETEREILLIRMLSAEHLKEEKEKIVKRLFTYLPETNKERIIYRLLEEYNNTSLTANAGLLLDNKDKLTRLFAVTTKELYRRLFQFLIAENTGREDTVIYNFILLFLKAENMSLQTLNDRIESLEGNNFPFANALKQIITAGQKAGKEKDNTAPPKDEATAKKKQAAAIEQEGIYIGNAGLVLLHPFLSAYFSEAGLLTNQSKFISVSAQQKAAVLLYYLQCGSEAYKEWEMALNKVFCGIASEDVLANDIVISDKEKDEAKALLQAAADYWEALKGASGEALQNTFILREGKITWKKEYWLIQVERTGADILLDRLPWGYNTIKLPWLEHLIYTEW